MQEEKEFVYKYRIHGVTDQNREEKFRQLLQEISAIKQVDVNREKGVVRIISRAELAVQDVQRVLSADGFRLEEIQDASPSIQTQTVCVRGMTCRSCEISIERSFRKLPGIISVTAHATTGKVQVTGSEIPSASVLQEALKGTVYVVENSGLAFEESERPTFVQLIGVFALVFIIGWLLSRIGIFRSSVSIGAGTSLGAIFVLGLVAASSSCLAVSGGLLLSSAAAFNARYKSATFLGRMRPVFLFVSGRLLSYGILGGVIGVIGKALQPSPFVIGFITIIAACYMIVMGLSMLHLAPRWLKGLLPGTPKSISHQVMKVEGKQNPFVPFLLGAATFFLPCGFTQALQLSALTTGSFFTGGSMLFVFALGTAPALLALGWASSSLKGKAGKYFFHFAGALVIVLGLLNIQNGLTVAGYPLSLPSFSVERPAQAATSGTSDVIMEGNTQVIRMKVNYNGYVPDTLTIRAGVPTRWDVDGTNATGCISVLVARQFGIQQLLKTGTNSFTFTAPAPGTYPFSCSMGMYRGQIVVVPN